MMLVDTGIDAELTAADVQCIVRCFRHEPLRFRRQETIRQFHTPTDGHDQVRSHV
jgi:hypothetical protein